MSETTLKAHCFTCKQLMIITEAVVQRNGIMMELECGHKKQIFFEE